MFVASWAAIGCAIGMGLAWLLPLAVAPATTSASARQPHPRVTRWHVALGATLALAFALLAMRRSFGPELLVVSGYAAILSAVAVLDLRHRLVYPAMTHPSTVAAIVLTPLALGQPAWSGLVGGLLGALAFFGLYRLAAQLHPGGEALGFGDVLIAGLLGAMLGFPDILQGLLLGVVAGGLAALVVGLAQRSLRAHFAYGPALCLGGLLVLLS